MVVNDDLFSIIKKVALNAVMSSKPADWCYGCVKSVKPVAVAINDKLVIDEGFIEWGSRNTEELEEGDKLILLRKAGGQLFLCLDVVRKTS